jgi:hypothetical protein
VYEESIVARTFVITVQYNVTHACKFVVQRVSAHVNTVSDLMILFTRDKSEVYRIQRAALFTHHQQVLTSVCATECDERRVSIHSQIAYVLSYWRRRIARQRDGTQQQQQQPDKRGTDRPSMDCIDQSILNHAQPTAGAAVG